MNVTMAQLTWKVQSPSCYQLLGLPVWISMASNRLWYVIVRDQVQDRKQFRTKDAAAKAVADVLPKPAQKK